MNKQLVIIAALSTALLGGCASSHYFLNGKKYDNSEVFQSAVDSGNASALAQIQPLSAPLTPKKLIVSLPSEEAIYAENARRHQTAMGSELRGIGVEQNKNLSHANYKMNKVFFDAIQKRGIFSEVVVKQAPIMVTSLEPAPGYDVMYYTEPAISTGQYFYASVKHGKQVFAFDRSIEGPIGQVNAFVAAVEALAIRD